jgi:hypothetical protein
VSILYVIAIGASILGLYFLAGFSIEMSIVIALLATIVGLLIGESRSK